MRKPKIENKYNLTMKDIRKLKVGDESKICEPLFWRNDIINAWCIYKEYGTASDKMYCTDNSFWIGIYDKPYYRKRVHVKCNCWGGMGSYEFNTFYNEKNMKNENDLQVQEGLLKTINHLIDDGILVIEEKIQC